MLYDLHLDSIAKIAPRASVFISQRCRVPGQISDVSVSWGFELVEIKINDTSHKQESDWRKARIKVGDTITAVAKNTSDTGRPVRITLSLADDLSPYEEPPGAGVSEGGVTGRAPAPGGRERG